MRIGARLAIALGLTLALTGLIVMFVTSKGLVGGFETLERELAVADANRVDRGFEQMVGKPHEKSGDWSNWDDTAGFIASRNAEYVDSNLQPESLADIGLDAMLFFDRNQNLIHGVAIKQGGAEQLSPKKIAARLHSEQWMAKAENKPNEGVSGILVLGSERFIISLRPIRKSDRSPQIYGFIAFVTRIDSDWSQDLRKLVGQDVTLTKPNSDLKLLQELTSRPGVPIVRPVSDTKIATFSLVSDVTGKPAFVL